MNFKEWTLKDQLLVLTKMLPLFIYKSLFLIYIFHPYLSLLIYFKLSEIFENMRFLKI
jgi:hypothetical protein